MKLRGVWVQLKTKRSPALLLEGTRKVYWIYSHHDLPGVPRNKWVLSNHVDTVPSYCIWKEPWKPSLKSFVGFWDSLTNQRRPLTSEEKTSLASICTQPRTKKRPSLDRIALNLPPRTPSLPNVYTASANPQIKREINELFARASLPVRGRVLILDTSEMYTAKVLQEQGWPLSRVDIPNPIEYDDFPILSGANVENVWAYDMIRNASTTWDVVWLDYCCTWRGNRDCSPYVDVKWLMENGGPTRLLALTLSTRNAQGTVRRVCREVEKWAKKKRRKLRWVERAKRYGTQMIFLMCRFL